MPVDYAGVGAFGVMQVLVHLVKARPKAMDDEAGVVE
jgi:hypothetical protein